MTRKIVPFRLPHWKWLGPDVEGEVDFPPSPGLELPTSWTAVVDGDVVAIGGTWEIWRGRHIAWAAMNAKAKPHLLFITRAARRVLDAADGRVEMTVRQDFLAGHKWARLLGFQVETPRMPHYGRKHETHVGYVRIKCQQPQ